MSQTIAVELKGSINASTGGLKYSEQFGRVGGAGSIDGSARFTDGNGTGQANQTHGGTYTIAPGGTLYFDLKNGTGSREDVLREPLALVTLKGILIELVTPGAGNSLEIGGNGNASAPVPLGNSAGNLPIKDIFLWTDPAGVSLATGAANICVKNPSAANQTFELRIWGNK